MSVADVHYTYVDSKELLDQCIARIGAESVIALDTEGSSLYSYKDKVCLIQLATSQNIFIIDPLDDLNCQDLFACLKDKLLVLHGADYDLRMLYIHYGFDPQVGVFDTMLAAELLGNTAFSLAALLEEYFDQTISKSSQKSNWGKRPLSEKQLLYAGTDVAYLIDLHRMLKEKLKELGRESWHEEWCQKVARSVKVQKKREEVWRIKGSGVLERKELNYLKHLWTWRDQEARKQDKPSFKIMSNQFLLRFTQIAVQCRSKIIRHEFKVPKNVKQDYHVSILKQLEKAAQMPQEKWPEKKTEERPVRVISKEYFTLVKSQINKKAKDLGLRPSLIVSNSDLTIFLKMQKNLGFKAAFKKVDLMSWQKDILKEVFESIGSFEVKFVNI